MKDDFAVFILTYGRPDRVYTFDTLREQGYTGKVFLVCSDDDVSLPEYKKRFGENVVVFNKQEALKGFDIGDNFEDDRVVVFARNICFEVASRLGLGRFIEMDDDYVDFQYRYEESGKLRGEDLPLDKVFEAYFRFLEVSGATCIALAQGGDFIGGTNSGMFKQKIYRKLMNVYFCDVKKPFKFYGRLNEDATTCAHLGRRGALLLTPMQFMALQKETQSNAGGLSDIYRERGTYFKSFYTVMYEPSCARIRSMGDGHSRIHHKIIGSYAYPKILSWRLKK